MVFWSKLKSTSAISILISLSFTLKSGLWKMIMRWSEKKCAFPPWKSYKVTLSAVTGKRLKSCKNCRFSLSLIVPVPPILIPAKNIREFSPLAYHVYFCSFLLLFFNYPFFRIRQIAFNEVVRLNLPRSLILSRGRKDVSWVYDPIVVYLRDNWRQLLLLPFLSLMYHFTLSRAILTLRANN